MGRHWRAHVSKADKAYALRRHKLFLSAQLAATL
jgi:hypothetical protein